MGKIKEKLKLAKRKNRRIGSGRKEKYPEAEASLKTWLIEFRKDGIAVTSKMVKIYMKELLTKQFAHVYPDSENAMDGSEGDLFGQNEEEIDENEREIVDIDSDSADELEEEIE